MGGQALQWQLLQQLVQLAWQQFVLTEGQCWSLVLVEAQKSPDPLDCCGAAPGPALSPVMSMRQWGRGLAGVAGGCGTAAAAVAGGVGEERAGVPLVLDQLVSCIVEPQYWSQTGWLGHVTVVPVEFGTGQMEPEVLAGQQAGHS